ncbi:MAG: hypothetical protein GY757_02955, partial [bacterium]|nr:hypothetical protein [bacterium]
IAFKSRNPEYLIPEDKNNFKIVKAIAAKEGLSHLTGFISSVEYAIRHEHIDNLWETVRTAPQNIAGRQEEFIVQMIDEFQFLNARIYWDKEKKNLADSLAGGYLGTAESKVAPLLVSGSWVGWLMNELMSMLPSRFRYEYLENMPQDEAVEMIYKFSRFFDVPVTEETVYAMANIAEGSPFYISSIIRSSLRKKDLSTLDGLTDTLEFESLDDRGAIKITWMEYISGAFPQINDRNAKNIVLYLCKNRDRELTRADILRDLKLDMTDAQLEKRLKALVKVDVISQGKSNFRYRGVNDNIFDKVFRGVYEEEIHQFDLNTIKEEYIEEFVKIKKQYVTLLGKHNYQKGLFAEYAILDQLKFRGRKKNDLLKSITRYLPDDFDFCEYDRVWRYDHSPVYAKNFNVDIYARAAAPGDYSIIGEVKCRDSRTFSKDEVLVFEKKFHLLIELENIERAVGFIFSRSGFTKDAEDYCKQKGFACSEEERWLE